MYVQEYKWPFYALFGTSSAEVGLQWFTPKVISGKISPVRRPPI